MKLLTAIAALILLSIWIGNPVIFYHRVVAGWDEGMTRAEMEKRGCSETDADIVISIYREFPLAGRHEYVESIKSAMFEECTRKTATLENQ